jgi:nuclear pore complex protein Nup98-Nup96
LFNKPATPTPSLFGGNAFGQNNNQQQQPTLGLGATTTTQPTGGLFGGFGLGGQQQQQQQPQQQQPQQGTGTGGFGLFGGATNAAPPTGTLFGGTNTLAPPVSNAAAPSGSVFGKPALGFGQQTAPAFGQTGNAFAQPQQTGFGLGQSQAQQQPPVLTASIDHNIFNTNPLLARLQPGPQLIRLNEPEKTPEAPPLQYSRRHFTKQQPPKLGKLRGFSTPPPAFGTSDAREQSPFRTSSVEPGLRSASPSKLLTGLSDSIASGGSPSGILGPDAFKSRSSVKKLVLPHRIDPNDFEGSVRANVDAAKAGKLGTIAPDRQKPVGESIKWNPHMESAARDALTSPSMTESLPSSASLSTPLRPRPGSRINPSASASSSALSPAKDTSPSLSPPKSATGSAPFDLTKLKHGEYWARPPIAELQSYGFAQLQNLESLTVGRIDYGEVTFLSKVDVTSIKAISDIPGGIVLFNERECIVYPDEEIKPPVGEGLNVPAKITLLGCWALDKATREPVKDVEAPRYKQHLKKLKSMKDTEFLSFDNEKGTWVFKVPHFTRYGIDDEEMEESDADANADLPDELMDTDRSRPPVYEINLHSTIPALMSHRENPTDPPPSSDAVNRRANVSGDRIIPPPTKRKTPEHETVQPSRKPWASSLGLDSRRIQVMQASFFGDAGADPLPPPLGRSSILPSFPTSVRRQERANVDMDEESDGGNLASAVSLVIPL